MQFYVCYGKTGKCNSMYGMVKQVNAILCVLW